MFGYLKFDKRQVQQACRNTYKYYYCGLCNALKKNYGILSTLFLSNDVAYLAVMIANRQQSENKCCPQCSIFHNKRKIASCYACDEWRGLATFSLGLVYAKTVDNDLDESSIHKHIKSIIVRLLLHNAYTQNKEIFDAMKKAICTIKVYETNKCDIITQSQVFSQFIQNALSMCFTRKLDDDITRLIIPTMKWLCFIDAIDDYETDIKAQQYNPFIFTIKKAKGSPSEIAEWGEFFSSNWKQLTAIYSDLYHELIVATNQIENCKVIEKNIIDIMCFQQMPQRLLTVMKEHFRLL